MVETNFKQTEIGLIPEDWEIRELGELGDVKMCKRIFQDQTTEFGDIPFFKIGTFGKEPDAFISRKHFEEFKYKFSYPKKGDILISAAGTIGRIVVYNGEESYFQDSNIVWINNTESVVSNKFLKFLLNVVNYNTEGGTIQRLYNSILKSTKFVRPPFPEQDAILNSLGDADAWIESLEKLVAKKRLIKQGTMQQLLTPKEDWEVKKLGEHIKFKTGFPFSSQFFNKKEDGLRLVKNRDLRSDDSIVFYNGDYLKSFIVTNGDLLIGMDGDFEPILWKKGIALLNQRVGRVQKLDDICIPFLSYVLIKQLKEIENMTGSTTVKHLSHSDIENIECLLPNTSEEQIRIANILSDMDAGIDALENKLQKAQQIKQGMMQQLLTGKIRLVAANKAINYKEEVTAS